MQLLMAVETQSSLFLMSGCALVDTIDSLHGSDGVVIVALEVYELCSKIHEILDNAVSQWASNMTCILAYLFNSASRQCCEVWASQFPFLHRMFAFMDASTGLWHRPTTTNPLGLFQFLTSMRSARGKARAVLWFNVQKWPVPESGGASLAKRHHLDPSPHGHQDGRKSVGDALISTNNSWKKVSCGGCHS